MPLKYPDIFAPFLPVLNINLKLQITSLHFRNPHLH
ncbi:unnamed protein product [Tenebrio molitor]|nr:unnamed protein product [Tenebrio molitor]